MYSRRFVAGHSIRLVRCALPTGKYSSNVGIDVLGPQLDFSPRILQDFAQDLGLRLPFSRAIVLVVVNRENETPPRVTFYFPLAVEIWLL